MNQLKPKQSGIFFLLSIAILLLFPNWVGGQSQGKTDARISQLEDADHFQWAPPEPFPDRAAWEARASELRRKVLLAAGLWPAPEKTPLNSSVFDWKEGEGFRVAKVYFESFPGFLATGNLYMPKGLKAPYPAILTPHGHWQYGRLENNPDGSIPGRCIDFARQGYVVFAIDMVGYNDSFQLPHDGNKSRAQLKGDTPLPYEPRMFQADFDFPAAGLYGISLGGLQLLNSIRAIDFLTSLPEVDPERIGVTGASGGATQTILAMTVDPRVKVAAPVNIIGAEKQPGCGCENIPGLWIGTSTIELAAAFAPKPLLLVSATRDPWTNSTPTRELPMLQKYYRLFGAEDRIANTHIDAGHNYNAKTRAAVYAFFRKYLNPGGPVITDPAPVAAETKTLGDLRVFPDRLLPAQAKSGREVIRDWEQQSEASFAKALPSSRSQLDEFSTRYREALRTLLAVEVPSADRLNYVTEAEEQKGDWVLRREEIGRSGQGDQVELESLRHNRNTSEVMLLVAPEAFGALQPEGGLGLSLPWLRPVLDRGFEVYRVRGYASGQYRIPDRTWNSFSWPEAYNRSNQILAIQDVLTAISSIRQAAPDQPLTLVALGDTGIQSAIAAAIHGKVDRVVIDLNHEDPGYDGTLVRLLNVGSIRRVGDFRTAMTLLASKPLALINPGPTFDGDGVGRILKPIGLDGNLKIHTEVAPTDPGFTRVLF